MGLHEIKKLLQTKDMVTKLKRPLTEWEKIFGSYTSDKLLITNIYRELKKTNLLKINNSMNKWTKELNRPFLKEEVQKAKKHMKKCSPSLVIKEMQIKTTLRFHFTPVRMATIKNTTANVGKDVGKKNLHTLVVGI
jgi:hypothetical protein